jgi:hypothetical protein
MLRCGHSGPAPFYSDLRFHAEFAINIEFGKRSETCEIVLEKLKNPQKHVQPQECEAAGGGQPCWRRRSRPPGPARS